MAKCLDCGCIFCVYGGSEGHPCPKCNSKNVDASMEIGYVKKEDKQC